MTNGRLILRELVALSATSMCPGADVQLLAVPQL